MFGEVEGELKPKVVVIIVVAFFAEPTRDFDSVLHGHLFFSHLDHEDIFIFVFHLVDDLRNGLASCFVDAFVHGDQVDVDRLWRNGDDVGR